jgi:hypothetical protein
MPLRLNTAVIHPVAASAGFCLKGLTIRWFTRAKKRPERLGFSCQGEVPPLTVVDGLLALSKVQYYNHFRKSLNQPLMAPFKSRIDI